MLMLIVPLALISPGLVLATLGGVVSLICAIVVMRLLLLADHRMSEIPRC